MEPLCEDYEYFPKGATVIVRLPRDPYDGAIGTVLGGWTPRTRVVRFSQTLVQYFCIAALADPTQPRSEPP